MESRDWSEYIQEEHGTCTYMELLKVSGWVIESWDDSVY